MGKCGNNRSGATAMNLFERRITKALYPYRNSINSKTYKSTYIISGYIFRIAFNGNFRILRSIFPSRKALKYFCYFINRENRGSSSAKIKSIPYERFLRIVGPEVLMNLIFKKSNIPPFFSSVKYGGKCKFTIRTLLSTKWNMNIKVPNYRRINYGYIL
ncbi:MAG: hypothetical protein HHAS10_09060 [Candidatus Altimarinota bacterium]